MINKWKGQEETLGGEGYGHGIEHGDVSQVYTHAVVCTTFGSSITPQ